MLCFYPCPVWLVCLFVSQQDHANTPGLEGCGMKNIGVSPDQRVDPENLFTFTLPDRPFFCYIFTVFPVNNSWILMKIRDV